MRVIRDSELYASPAKIFNREIKPFWPEPGKGSGIVCLYPTQALLEYWEDSLIKEFGSFGGARFLLFAGLIREIWEENRTNWISLSGEVISLVLRKLFLELKGKGAIPYYAQALESPGFFSSLKQEITSLKRSGVSAREFTGWVEKESRARAVDRRRGLHDFSLIYQEYQRLLSLHHWADPEEKLWAATCDLKKSIWVKNLSHLFVIGFSDFTNQQEKFLLEFDKMTKVTILLDTSADGRQGVYGPRLKVEGETGKNTSISRSIIPNTNGGIEQKKLRIESSNLHYLQDHLWKHNLWREDPCPPKSQEDESVCLRAIDGGWRREMKSVAIEAREVLYSNPSLSPSDIGIITPYTVNMEEIYEIFELTGLPVSGQVKKALRFQSVARALLQPFIASAKNFSWTEMIKLLRWAGVVPVEKLYSVIPEGLLQWRALINELYPDLETDFIFDFLERIPDKAQMKEYFALCRRWLTTPQILQAFIPIESRKKILNKERFFQTSIISTARELLSELVDVSELILDWEICIEDFILVLEGILTTGTKNIAYGWGNGIRVLSPQEARGLRFKVTFITGLNEGIFPTHSSSGWVLNERDLSFWRRKGFSIKTATEDLMMQRLLFHNALTSATEVLTLSCSRSDEAGHPINPSTFWEDVRSLLPGIPLVYPIKGFSLDYSTLPSPEKGRNTILYSPGMEKAERSRGWGRNAYGGILGVQEVQEIKDDFTRKPIGITALEEYAVCPFAFYCARLLKLVALTEPTYLPDRMEEGSIYHEALRDFFRKHRGEALKAENFLTYLQEIKELINNYYPDLSEDRSLIYRNLCALNQEAMFTKLSRLIKEEINWQQRINGAYRPRFVELGFGGPVPDREDDSTGLYFEIKGNDVSLKLRGKIDRVDLGEDGGFIVYDYKSGGSSRAKEIKEGKLLQLPLYLQALQELYPEARKALGMTYYSLSRSERKDGFWRAGFGSRFNMKLRELKEEEWQLLLDLSREKALQYYKGIISGKYPSLSSKEKCPAYCRFKWVCRQGVAGGKNDECYT